MTVKMVTQGYLLLFAVAISELMTSCTSYNRIKTHCVYTAV